MTSPSLIEIPESSRELFALSDMYCIGVECRIYVDNSLHSNEEATITRFEWEIVSQSDELSGYIIADVRDFVSKRDCVEKLLAAIDVVYMQRLLEEKTNAISQGTSLN